MTFPSTTLTMTKLVTRYYWLLFFVATFAAVVLRGCLDWFSSTIFFSDNNPRQRYTGQPVPTDSLFGYESTEQLNGRSQRFPSVDERVRLYMSNWYYPAECELKATNMVSYRRIGQATLKPFRELIVEELAMNGTEIKPRRFLIDSQNNLGKLHFLEERNMLPESCDSEYCADMIHYLIPSWKRLKTARDVPIIFQFSDEETSRAFSPGSQKNELYPAVPHLKKSRLSIPNQSRQLKQVSCSQLSPPLSTHDSSLIPVHFHPILFKLKTNRHYGMLERIPPQDVPWHEKKNKVVFRGTLTGMLAANSKFSMAYRNSNSSMLKSDDALAKCRELERCRLVYEANAANRSDLVDAALVKPRLQHIDVPEHINNISMFGNRMTKQGLLKNKAIVMLEGNDAGTGLKWALFSNSVVFAPSTLQFTSWAMEELLRPWYHYIPLDINNFGNDLHDKMRWVIDHDEEAHQIALQGSLWIRDLWMHPDSNRDDEQITDAIIKQYLHLFREDPNLEL